MVKYWAIQIDKGIALTKMRIKHHEKHGNGNKVIEEKRRLVIQERNKELRKK